MLDFADANGSQDDRIDVRAYGFARIGQIGKTASGDDLILTFAGDTARRRATTISVVRIVLEGLVGIAVAALFGLTGSMRAVLILQCANPVAFYNCLFAQRWNNQPEEVAGVVVLSTLLSLLSIPLVERRG